ERGMGNPAFAALTDVIPSSRAQNGRFFGYVQGSGEPIAALGDFLGSILNQNITAWRSSPANYSVCPLPEEGYGLICSVLYHPSRMFYVLNATLEENTMKRKVATGCIAFMLA